ncbi:hypothetical protein MRS76_11250 [Rhizobiaceae bacterium n13]|uniref:hypothetical protein n=1 Tax=Ferirhizobium litorale TaxID=2927786 RepID=UPI0024B2FE73|nr:hypothetical protein [Fererhizobium litorale]MDI7862537.1 hypothetical protein [Fererhizobium litorale]
MLSPDEAGGGGGSADSADPGAGGGDPAGGQGGEGGEGGDQPPVRPDYIPESYWDAQKGFKSDDFNALVAFKAEHDSNMAQVPEKPDAYEAKLPQDFKLPEGFELPEGEELIDANDPRIALARDFAHAHKMSQSDFEQLIAVGVQMDIAEQGRLKEGLEAEREKLGPNAKTRVGAVTSWLGAKIGGEFADALAPMMFTAKSIQAFEALMRLNRGDVPGNPGAGRDTGKTELSDEEYNKMSPTERINYARQNSKKTA